MNESYEVENDEVVPMDLCSTAQATILRVTDYPQIGLLKSGQLKSQITVAFYVSISGSEKTDHHQKLRNNKTREIKVTRRNCRKRLRARQFMFVNKGILSGAV